MAALESRISVKGVNRIRFADGWVSEKTATGQPILEQHRAQPDPEQKLSPAAPKPPIYQSCTAWSGPRPVHQQVLVTYTLARSAIVRTGFEMDSDKAIADGGMLCKGQTLRALEVRTNATGINRVRFAGGWVSEKTAGGMLILERCTGGRATQEPSAGSSAVISTSRLVLDKLEVEGLEAGLLLDVAFEARDLLQQYQDVSKRIRTEDLSRTKDLNAKSEQLWARICKLLTLAVTGAAIQIVNGVYIPSHVDINGRLFLRHSAQTIYIAPGPAESWVIMKLEESEQESFKENSKSWPDYSPEQWLYCAKSLDLPPAGRWIAVAATVAAELCDPGPTVALADTQPVVISPQSRRNQSKTQRAPKAPKPIGGIIFFTLDTSDDYSKIKPGEKVLFQTRLLLAHEVRKGEGVLGWLGGEGIAGQTSAQAAAFKANIKTLGVLGTEAELSAAIGSAVVLSPKMWAINLGETLVNERGQIPNLAARSVQKPTGEKFEPGALLPLNSIEVSVEVSVGCCQ